MKRSPSTQKRTRLSQSKVNAAKQQLEKQTSNPALKPAKSSSSDLVNPKSAGVEIELEPFKFYSLLDKQTAEKLKSDTLRLKGLARERHLMALQMGRIISYWKEQLPYGIYTAWVTQEFGPIMSIDTANNYCMLAELYKKYSEEELKNLPLNALYVIGRRTVSPEIRESVLLAAAQSPKRLSKKDVQNIVKSYRELQLEIAGVADEVKPMLMQTDLAENATELQKLAKLPAQKQAKAVELIHSQNAQNVRQAVSQLQSAKQQESILEAEILTSLDYQDVLRREGNWLDLLHSTEAESIDFCFAEMPLHKAVLEDYGKLAQEMHRVLRPGGLLLATVGQQNLQFVGSLLEPPLKILWTFMLLRRPGFSPRVVGRVSFASSYVPLSLSAKPPLKLLPGLIDDLRSWTPENDLKFHFKDEKEILPTEEMVELNNLESSLDYYVKSLLSPTETFMHFVYDQSTSFGITDALYKSAFEVNAGKVLALTGV